MTPAAKCRYFRRDSLSAMLNTKLKAAGGKMRLCGLKPEIHEVFVITKLTKVFDIKPDENEALNGF